MTTAIVGAITALIAIVAGWLLKVQHGKGRQARAQAEHDRCQREAETKAEEAYDEIAQAHPDDTAARLAAMAEYINS